MHFLGDIHADFDWWTKITSRGYCKSSIQLGDFGMGFLEKQDSKRHFKEIDGKKYSYHPAGVDSTKHKFIHGNHDDPVLCAKSPHFLGRYGYIEKLDLFYISGAFSTDKDPQYGSRVCGGGGPYSPYVQSCDGCEHFDGCNLKVKTWIGRTEGENWWAGEQLFNEELEKMVALYEEAKPRIVVSHTCPSDVIKNFTSGRGRDLDRTGNFLSKAWSTYKPEHWLFGHIHNMQSAVIDGTKFRCIGINQFYEIPDIDF